MIVRVLCIFFLFSLLSLHRGNAEPYTYLMRKGNRYYKNALFRDALSYFQKGREKNSKSSVPAFNEGAALHKLEDYSGSIHALSEALSITDDEEKISQIHYNLGNNYFKLGDYDRAIQHYIKGLEHNPYDLNLKYNLELALKKRQEHSQSAQKEEEDKNKEGGKSSGEKDEERGEGERSADQLDQESQESREFSKADAQRLVDSLNNDQSRIMNEIIQNRAGRVQNEKDW